MEFKDGKVYKVRLLRDISGHYGVSYGKTGDVIELKHSKRYATYGKLSVTEGHGYGTQFEPGVDVEVLELPKASSKHYDSSTGTWTTVD